MLVIICCSLESPFLVTKQSIFSHFQSSADFSKGKRNNSNTRKGKKIDDEANSSSPSKKLQWSPGSFACKI